MIEITTKETPIEEELKRKIDFICEFCNVKATIINSTIRRIKKNLNYIEKRLIS